MILDMYLYLCRHMGPLAASVVLGVLYGGLVVIILLCLPLGSTDLRYFNI